MGLFSGLEKFGLGKLEKMDVFEEEKKRDAVPWLESYGRLI